MQIVVKKMKEESVNKFSKEEWRKHNVERYGRKGWKIDDQFKKNYTIAAFNSKQTVGVAKFRVVGGVGVLETIIVKNSLRNIGIGQELLMEFENICKKMKCHKLRLSTEVKSHAFLFYRKNGYKVEAKLKNDYMNRDRVYMSKRV
jgi:ribosomal protein S18 acetylase RimI-like enzyme